MTADPHLAVPVPRTTLVPRWSLCRWLACVLAVSALAGCGAGSTNLETAAAEGVVLLDGQPLADADVAFSPEKGPTATARTDAEGKFKLMTYRAGDGAVAGKHTVTVNKQVAKGKNAQGYTDYQSVVPALYVNPAKSPLTATIPPGGDKSLKIELKQ